MIFRPTTHQLAILNALQNGSRTAAQLRQENGIPRGSINTICQRMEAAGLLVSHPTWNAGGPRRWYRLSKDGKRLLRATQAFDACYANAHP